MKKANDIPVEATVRLYMSIGSLLIGLLLTVGISGCAFRQDASAGTAEKLHFNESNKYILYIGTNDKDELRPLMTRAEVKKKVSAIFLKYTDGFTLLEGKGVWPDPSGQSIQEDSLICVFMNINEDQVRLIADEILKELNQHSILVEKASTGILFYDASKQIPK